YLFTSEPWTRPRQVDRCWILGRFGPKTKTPPARTAELARFRGWGRALLVRQLKDIARQSMPTLYRFYVQRTTREWAARLPCKFRSSRILPPSVIASFGPC